MSKVIINNIEIKYMLQGNGRKIIAIPSKIELVEYALTLDNSNDCRSTSDRVKFIYNVADVLEIKRESFRSSFNDWISKYKAGLLNLDNVFNTAKKPTTKVKITLSETISNKANEITILKQQLDKLTNELSVLRQAESLMNGVEL